MLTLNVSQETWNKVINAAMYEHRAIHNAEIAPSARVRRGIVAALGKLKIKVKVSDG